VEKVIQTIQALIQKPPITVSYQDDTEIERLQNSLQTAQQTIRELESKLATVPISPPNDTPFGEDLEVIKQLEITSLTELFGSAVEDNVIRQIQDAVNYQQVVQARQNFLTKQLKDQSGTTSLPVKNLSGKERVVWLSLLVVSLVMIGGLLLRLRGKGKRKELNQDL